MMSKMVLKLTFKTKLDINVFQTEVKEFADDNFKFDEKWQKVFQTGRKHFGKRRNCSLSLSQMTNFRLFENERICRGQFQI